jgi:hypothetical protein
MGFLPTVASRRRSCPSARPSFCKAVNRLTLLLALFTVQQVRPAGRTQKNGRAGKARPFENEAGKTPRRLE